LTREVGDMQRPLAGPATLEPGSGCELFVDARGEAKKCGFSQNSPEGILLIKIPEGDPVQNITERDRQRRNRHQERWRCSRTGVKSFRDDRRHLLERQGAPTIRAKATSTTKRVARRSWMTARRCGSLHRHDRRPVVTSQTPIAPGKGGRGARSFS